MAEQIKLTDEEIKTLRDLQTRTLAIKQEMSDIGMIKLNIKMRQYQAEVFYSKTLDLEKQLGKVLEEKYGRGNVDLETGTFTPVQDK